MFRLSLVAYFIFISIHPLKGMEEDHTEGQNYSTPLKVVVADDHAMCLKILKSLFNNSDEVISVVNGMQIVDVMLNPTHRNVDMLITDGKMTTEDGLEANGTDAIKVLRALGFHQVMILVTSETDVAFLEGCDATAIFPKPLKVSLIKNMIEEQRHKKRTHISHSN